MEIMVNFFKKIRSLQNIIQPTIDLYYIAWQRLKMIFFRTMESSLSTTNINFINAKNNFKNLLNIHSVRKRDRLYFCRVALHLKSMQKCNNLPEKDSEKDIVLLLNSLFTMVSSIYINVNSNNYCWKKIKST